jgi:hypothetical protein
MLSGSAGGALPWAVVRHRTFDAKVSSIEVGDDQEKRRGRIRGEVGLHAPSPTTNIEPDKGRYQAQHERQAGQGCVISKIMWRALLNAIWRKSATASVVARLCFGVQI